MGVYINNASTARYNVGVYRGSEMIVINDRSGAHAPEKKYGYGYSVSSAIRNYVSFRANVKRKK